LIAAVRSAAPECKFLAWTPGVAAERLASLAGCGFDAAFTSSAWWDFRSPWLAGEALRLRPFGALIATVAVAGQDPAAHRQASPANAGTSLFDSRLWLAALTGDGLLVSREALASAGESPATLPAALKPALALCASRPAAPAAAQGTPWHMLSAPDAPAAILEAAALPQAGNEGGGRWVLAVNPGEAPVLLDLAAALARFDGLAAARSLWPAGEAPGDLLELAPGEARVLAAVTGRNAGLGPRDARRALRSALQAPRVAIECITPCVDGGRFVAKRCVGDRLAVEADIFGEGHDLLAACVQWRTAGEEEWREVPMRLLANDRWRAELPLNRLGRYEYRIEAWPDVFGAWRDEITKKSARAGNRAGVARRPPAARGGAGARGAGRPAGTQTRPEARGRATGRRADSGGAGPAAALRRAAAMMAQADTRAFSVCSAAMKVDAERRAAGFSSWYELFPRSLGPDAASHGTLRDVVARLPAIAAMGFDTLYFPPIHPIGRKHRKGPNNSLQAGPDDPGSPYAIGAAEGGHDAIHPELGTLDDFRALHRAAKAHGLELALDFAIQCRPTTPGCNRTPTGSTGGPTAASATPRTRPKNTRTSSTSTSTRPARCPSSGWRLRDIVLFWVAEGVKVFRVDNPHTKPMPFWEWLIDEVRSRSPDVIFLAEAFTRPKPMYRLAKLGFSQSYSYFTWRHTKQEFTDYLTELAARRAARFFPAAFFRQHARHQSLLPAALGPRGLCDPRRAGGHAVGAVGPVQRV
jgi:starch synthase (maltosyl-transferring)